MSRRRRKSRSDTRFVALQHYLLNSPACISLPGDALKLFIYVWKRHNGSNNGEISFSVREAEEIGLTKSTAARMFRILVDRGFLAKVGESHFGRKRVAQTWRITAETYRNEKATNDFMRWKPSIEKPSDSPTNGTEELAPEEIRSPTSGTDSPHGGTKVIKLSATVPQAGLLGAGIGVVQSHGRDTYKIPTQTSKKRPPPHCPRLPDCVLLKLVGEC
jgi:hypothetical protein